MPSRAVAHHIAVARDIGRHDRHARGERFRQHHPEALAVQRRRAEHVRTGELFELLRLPHPAERAHALGVEQQRRHLRILRADQRERRRNLLAERLERLQEDRQSLAIDGLPDEEDAQRPPALLMRGVLFGRELGVLQVHAVGDDRVTAAEESPRGPRGRVGDGDADVQAVHAPRRAERDPDAVREPVLRVAVEGAHERHILGAAHRVPAHQRRDGLVDVRDVVAAFAQLPAQREDPARADREVGDRAVRRDAHRAPERDEAFGRLTALRRRAPVQAARQRVVGVEGRQHAHVVAEAPQLSRERLDMPRHAARVGPRVRRDERDSHAGTLAGRAGVEL